MSISPYDDIIKLSLGFCQHLFVDNVTPNTLFPIAAQFETEIRAERQMDGIIKAKEKGISFGRKKIVPGPDPTTSTKTPKRGAN